MSSPSHEGLLQEQPQAQEPAVVQIDPKCLHSALKEFFDPLRTSDSRDDFFAMYRRESGEFDRDYATKYDEDLNTSLIFAGLFSAVSSAFIIDVQSKLEPDPNDMTAAYMRILIHTMNNSLFPDADPNSATWTGPPSEIITVQSLLYASLTASLFAAFIAMLGKQWVNRYLRNHGGSAAEKSRDRQRKLDGFEKWHFHLAIESLPVMLQIALLLLGCALSLYLRTISHTVAGVVVSVTLFGVASYITLTLAATLYYNCPYQTPPSTLTRAVISYLTHGDAAFAHSLRSLITPLPSTKGLKRILGHLRSGVRSMVESFGCIPAVAEEAEHVPLAVVVAPPARIFEDIYVNWEIYKADARCISWVLDSTTDTDVISSTVRFAADVIWYPEAMETLSPHILADLFFDCLLDGRVIPGKAEHASSVGMALVSVLSIQLTVEPEDQALVELCRRIRDDIVPGPLTKSMFDLVVYTLGLVAETPDRPMEDMLFGKWDFHGSIPNNLPTTQKLWLSRATLQTLWRWRRDREPARVLSLILIGQMCRSFVADKDQTIPIIKTNCFLIMSISLGLQADIRDLYAPNDNDALRVAINLFYQQLQARIREGRTYQPSIMRVLFASVPLNPFQIMEDGEPGISLIMDILNSGYREGERYEMANGVVGLLGDWFDATEVPERYARHSWIPTLSNYLSLCEKFYSAESPPYPGSVALRILSTCPKDDGFCGSILPVLTSILSPAHPLQSRMLALRVFYELAAKTPSSHMENVLIDDLHKLLQAVGDPLQFIPDGQPVGDADSETMVAAVALIGFVSLDSWRNHLRPSNFTSFEEITATEEGRRTALKCMFNMATHWWSELRTPVKIIAAIRRLEELQCLNTAEVVILWAWAIGVMNPVDCDGRKLIEQDTLRFYQTRGIGRLTTLSRHITDTAVDNAHLFLLAVEYRGTVFRTRRPLVPAADLWSHSQADLHLSRVCQLRELCYLFGYDHTTWKEVVVVGRVGEGVEGETGGEVGVLRGRPATPAGGMDWMCDYP